MKRSAQRQCKGPSIYAKDTAATPIANTGPAVVPSIVTDPAVTRALAMSPVVPPATGPVAVLHIMMWRKKKKRKKKLLLSEVHHAQRYRPVVTPTLAMSPAVSPFHCGHSNPCNKPHSSIREAASASISCPYKQDEKISMKVRMFSGERQR